MIQASIDVHRASLKVTERARLLARIQQETGKTVTEIAAMLGISQSFASKHLALLRLAPEIRAMLDAGELDVERAYIISKGADHAEQRELLEGAPNLSREQLRQKASGQAPVNAGKASGLRLAMPGGYQVGLQGRDITFELAIQVLGETVRMLKKGHAQGLTLASQCKVMKDTAKAPSPAAAGGAQ